MSRLKACCRENFLNCVQHAHCPVYFCVQLLTWTSPWPCPGRPWSWAGWRPRQSWGPAPVEHPRSLPRTYPAWTEQMLSWGVCYNRFFENYLKITEISAKCPWKVMRNVIFHIIRAWERRGTESFTMQEFRRTLRNKPRNWTVLFHLKNNNELRYPIVDYRLLLPVVPLLWLFQDGLKIATHWRLLRYR